MRSTIICVLLQLGILALSETFVVTERDSLFVVTERSTIETAKLVADKRPVVRMYWATWCKHCPHVKESLQAADKAGPLPFRVELIDVTAGGHPDWCTQLPAFGWEAGGQTRYVLDFVSADILVKRWKRSQQPATQAASEIDSLTPQQRSMYEWAKRQGYSDDQIRRYAIKHGLINQ